jgi:hypothetical protein
MVAGGPVHSAEHRGRKRQTQPKGSGTFLGRRGSALECAAIQDVLAATGGLDVESNLQMKRKLKRIVAMLTRMAMKFDGVAESQASYHSTVDYEHEHEHEHEEMPEPDDAREWPIASESNG